MSSSQDGVSDAEYSLTLESDDSRRESGDSQTTPPRKKVSDYSFVILHLYRSIVTESI